MFQVFIWLIQEHAKIFSLRKAKARAKSQQLVIPTLHEEKKLNNLQMLKEALVP